MDDSHILLNLNHSNVRNFAVVNDSAGKGVWREESQSDLLTKADIDGDTNDSLIRTIDTIDSYNYNDNIESTDTSNNPYQKTMETSYNKKYSDENQSYKRNENLESSTVKTFPETVSQFISSDITSGKASFPLVSNLSTETLTRLNLTTDFHQTSTESMRNPSPNLVLDSSITKTKNEYLERKKSKMKQKEKKHDHFEKKKLRMNSTKNPLDQNQSYLTTTERSFNISNFDSMESVQDDDPRLHEETSKFGIPLLDKVGFLQENLTKRDSNIMLINNINSTSHPSVDILYEDNNPPTPQSLSRVIPHLDADNESSTKEPISLKRYTTSRSPLIKRTTDSILASNHGSNISVCSDDPCGAGVACHPTGKSFLCFCSDGTEVAPREPCPDIRPVNVTPPAISMPQANESLMRPSQVLILGSVITMALCIFVVIALFYFRRNKICKIMRQRNALKLSKSSSESVVKISTLHTYNFASNPNYYTSPPDQLPLQALSVQIINKSQIAFLGDLGEGCFGRVYKGEYEAKGNSEFDDDAESQFSSSFEESDLENKEPKDENKIPNKKKKKKKKTVAVKVLKELVGVEAEADFMREVEIMASFRHTNILSLIGIVVEADTGGTPWMVFEFMPYGDLAEVLRSCNKQYGKNYAPVKSLGKMELLNICIQVAAGMDYLSQQHFVHRDLACRNCLVGKNLTVKISDFGMSRDVYTCDYYKVGGSRMLPVRWMAPESILYGKFTLESDVWSFGVVLWEIYSFGKQPYYGNSNEEVVQLILQGILLSPCESCPPLVREVMRLCWCTEAQNRLTFPDIVERLQRAQESLEEDLLCQELFQHINYSRLSMHDTQSSLQIDKDQYLLPKKSVVTDEYLTVLGNL